MELLTRWINRIDNFLAYISAGTIFIMMMWIFSDVISRYFFNSPIKGTSEITGEYLLVIIFYLAISYTLKEDQHISVDILQRKLSRGKKRVLGLISNLIALFVFILLGVNNFQRGLEYFARDIRSESLLKYPLGPAFMIISLGILLLSVRLIFDSIKIIRNKKEL